jgi:hypothetical protein
MPGNDDNALNNKKKFDFIFMILNFTTHRADTCPVTTHNNVIQKVSKGNRIAGQSV